MAATKILGILVTFYLFVILEAFDQNFYAGRYGKREDSDSRGDKNILEERKFARRENQDALNDRKIRLFVTGGRFGKRGCNAENCSQGTKEFISSGFQTRRDQSDRIRIPSRKNQFLIGSRFGKRMENIKLEEAESSVSGKDLRCFYTGISDYYRCLDEMYANPEIELVDSTFADDFI